MIDFDAEETPLNRKDITAEITGTLHNFDEEEEPEELPQGEQTQAVTPSEPHPFIGIMDMLISTSQEPLRKRGYPAPNLEIWEEWGKPNLSKAFYQYMPIESGAGAAMNSPAFAGLLGFGALVLAFMPVILCYIDKKKKEKEEAEREAIEQSQPPQQSPAPAIIQAPAPAPAPEPEKPKSLKLETPDKVPEPKFVKLPGGGTEATPAIPMMKLIEMNIGADPQPI